MATEYACFPVRPGVEVMDESTKDHQALRQCVATVLEQPGAQRAYWAQEVENPGHIWLFVDWDKAEDHAAFTKAPSYKPMIESISGIFDMSGALVKHVIYDPFPPSEIMAAPTVEVMTAIFAPDIDPAGKEAAVAQFTDFRDKTLAKCADFRGVSAGWALETDVPVKDKPDQKGAMYSALIAWPSVDAHMKFRESDVFKENVALLRTMPGLLGLSMFHVSCKTELPKGK